MIHTLTANSHLFRQYKEDLITLYIEAFYQDDMSTLLRHNVATYFDELLEQGYALLCIDKKELKGAILLTSITVAPHIPHEITANITAQNSLYIAEVFVSQDSRGKGYGKQLMSHLTEHLDFKNKTLIIRVMTNNKPAIHLYEKFFFKPRCIITERKTDLCQNKMVLEKLYLTRKNVE